jgi:4-alpha-glucanotransferase
MPNPRASGILLHPTSLPTPYGIGDLGPSAYQFIDWLANSKQIFWQILPLGPTGYGNSPYMCYSAIAGNALLISPEELKYKGLLTDEDLSDIPDFPAETVDFDEVIPWKMALLKKAYLNFQNQPQEEFLAFCEEKASWLDDYALFMALKQVTNGKSWTQWDEHIKKRDPHTLKICHRELASIINFRKYLQFEFFRQWNHVKNYANDKGIKIIGDIPIYVSQDSVDVWANPELFCLHPKTDEPTLVAGVPPDYFSEDGQLWGNPIYNWYQIRKQNYRWWLQRFHGILNLVDWIRIDHFRGFEAYWVVKAGEKTARNGRWVKGPRSQFFQVVKDEFGDLPIIAEDLGDINEDVLNLRDEFSFPGMKILQFAFGTGSANPYLPHGFERNCIVYTGTHDNDTTVGWFNNADEDLQKATAEYLGKSNIEEIHWELIRAAFMSVADWAIVPVQDVLGLGSDHRMNSPGKAEGNWGWRYKQEDLTTELGDRLRNLSDIYGRIPGE